MLDASGPLRLRRCEKIKRIVGAEVTRLKFIVKKLRSESLVTSAATILSQLLSTTDRHQL